MVLIPYRAIATEDFNQHDFIAIRVPADAKPTDSPIPEAVRYNAARDEGVYPVGLVQIPAKKGEIVIYFRRDDLAVSTPITIDFGTAPSDLYPDIYGKVDE